MTNQYSYDVALSFAGEDRGYVEKVADYLDDMGISVFYDSYERTYLWGKNLHLHLNDVYKNKARYCVVFISEHYKQKVWTKHEIRSAFARALESDMEYILPARFDDTQIDGLDRTIAFIDLRKVAPNVFAQIIAEKLQSNPRPIKKSLSAETSQNSNASTNGNISNGNVSQSADSTNDKQKKLRNAIAIISILCTLMVLVGYRAIQHFDSKRAYYLDTNGTLTISKSLFSDGMQEYNMQVYGNNENSGDEIEVYSQSPWFDYRNHIITVIIADGVTSISSGAFAGCKNLESVYLPESLTNIGDYAFCQCDSLKKVSIPSHTVSIGKYAFCQCDQLEKVEFDDFSTIETFETGVFSDCIMLSSMNVVGSVFEDYDHGYDNSEDYANSDLVYIPPGVAVIGESAFKNCKSIVNVELPFGLSEIGSSAFYGCSNLIDITIPQDFAIINSSTFHNCTSLEYINIPEGVTEIGESAFQGCTNLAIVDVSYSVKKIRSSAFKDCSSLVSFSIPGHVTDIEGSVFFGCTSLISVNIPNGITEIWGCAFADCTSLMSIDIPNSVTSIGADAFAGCTSLSNVTIPDSVDYIEPGAFCGCTNLLSVSLPSGIHLIPNRAMGYGVFDNKTEIIYRNNDDNQEDLFPSTHNVGTKDYIHGAWMTFDDEQTYLFIATEHGECSYHVYGGTIGGDGRIPETDVFWDFYGIYNIKDVIDDVVEFEISFSNKDDYSVYSATWKMKVIDDAYMELSTIDNPIMGVAGNLYCTAIKLDDASYSIPLDSIIKLFFVAPHKHGGAIYGATYSCSVPSRFQRVVNWRQTEYTFEYSCDTPSMHVRIDFSQADDYMKWVKEFAETDSNDVEEVIRAKYDLYCHIQDNHIESSYFRDNMYLIEYTSNIYEVVIYGRELVCQVNIDYSGQDEEFCEAIRDYIIESISLQ